MWIQYFFSASRTYLVNENYKLMPNVFMNECFYVMCKTSLRFAAARETSENSLLIYSNHIPFRFGCRPREASRLEAKTYEAEAKTHEAEAKAEATTHEAEAEARFFGLEAEARPRGLTSLKVGCLPYAVGKQPSW